MDVKLKEIALNILVISTIVLFPHLELIPNFGYSIPILILVWLALRFTNENFRDIGFSFKNFKAHSILIGVIVAASTLAFMQLIFFPTLDYLVVFGETEVGLYDFIQGGIGQYIFMVIMAWLIGGLYEEIVFHGFLFTQLEKMIPGKYATHLAFILTSVLFGAYHIQLGMDGTINALIVGAVYLGLFLYFKRNLWYSIICHGVYNTLVITLIYLGYL